MSARPASLRKRLLLVVAAGILPIAQISAVALYALVAQQREHASRTGLEIARALSTAVDAELSRSVSVLQAIGTATLLETGDLRRYHQLVRRVVVTRPTWQAVLLHDASGKMVLSTNVDFGAALPQTVEPASITQAVASRQPTVGMLARGPRGEYAFPVRVPLVQDGEVRYVLSAVVRPDNIVAVVERQRLPQDWVVSVFDGRRQRVARSRHHEQNLGGTPAPSLLQLMDAQGREGSGTSQALEGDRVFTAYSRSAQTGWTVAIGIPTAFVETGTVRSAAVFGGGLLLSLVAGAWSALLLARGIVDPVERLRAAAQALGRREPFSVPQTSIGELRQVGDALRTAADERRRGDAEREDLLARERAARAAAEQANRAKDEFLAMLGHELRNPLGAISNATYLLEAPDAEAQRHARAVIGRQVQHLARMTDDLLDAARAMTGKIVLQRQPLDLAEAVARALATVRSTGKAGARRFEQRLEPVWVDADPTRIEQVVGNLLGNALKFTSERGTVTVSTGSEHGDAVLRVADDGIGMPPELTARVFDPFVQGERPLDRSQGGLGIGLTLVRRLAELHGGSASAESDGPGRGSVFTMRLPGIAPPAAATRPADRREAGRRRDVLIVEDNDDAREMLRRLLEAQGHRVRVAPDGVVALDVMRASPPEIALVDVGLPRMDGYELARRVRAELPEARRPYLVAVTGYGLPEDRERTREAGFDLHLVKPVDRAALDEVLAR